MENARDANGLMFLNRHTLEQIVATSAAGILVADAQNPEFAVVYVNPAYEKLTGYSAKEIVGRSWNLLVRPGDRGDAELDRLRAAARAGEACRARIEDRRKDGTSLPAELSLTPLHNSRGELKYLLCVEHEPHAVAGSSEIRVNGTAPPDETGVLSQDQGRQRPKSVQTERLDPVTGLLRLGLFEELLRRDLVVAQRDRRCVTLIALEIVDFDIYRQTFGDKAAESCQRMIATQITRTLRRAADLSARYDDAIFVAAVTGQEPAEVQPLADQIVANVRRLGLHNPRARTSRYIGVRAKIAACRPGEYTEPAAAIAAALSGAHGVDPQLNAVLA